MSHEDEPTEVEDIPEKEAEEEFKAFVGGISWHMSDRGLKDTFRKYGAVDGRVMLDKNTGRSRGFGFVAFPDKKSLEEAIGKMHGTELDGRRISVTRAIPQSETAPGTPASALARSGDRGRGYDRGGYDRGYGRAGSERGGGYDRGYARGGYDRSGYDRGGGYDRGYGERGYDRAGGYEYDRGYDRGYSGYGREAYGADRAGGYAGAYDGGYSRGGGYEYDRGAYNGGGAGYERGAAAGYDDRYQGDRAGYADRGSYGAAERGGYRGAGGDRAAGYDRYSRSAGGPDRDYGRSYAARPGPYDRKEEHRPAAAR